MGVEPSKLSDRLLRQELAHLHETRQETFLHGSDDALAAHSHRTRELEEEYLRRWPEREIRPDRTREGARRRVAA